MNKICSRCGKEKDISKYYVGYSYCKLCKSIQAKEYYNKNKDIIKQKTKTYAASHKDQTNMYKRKWDQNNKIKNKKSKQAYFNKNKINILKKKSLYYKLHPEKSLIYVRRRRALKYNLHESYSPEDIQYTYNLFNHQCVNCGSTTHLELDHHLPLSLGYVYSRTNAVVLCRSCNAAKCDKLPAEFYTPETLKLIEEKLKL